MQSRKYLVRGTFLAAHRTVDHKRTPNEFTEQEINAYRQRTGNHVATAPKVREILCKLQVTKQELDALTNAVDIPLRPEHGLRQPDLDGSALGTIVSIERDPITDECHFTAQCRDTPTLQRFIKYGQHDTKNRRIGVSMKHYPADATQKAELEEITLTFDPARDGCHVNRVECIDQDNVSSTIYQYVDSTQREALETTSRQPIATSGSALDMSNPPPLTRSVDPATAQTQQAAPPVSESTPSTTRSVEPSTESRRHRRHGRRDRERERRRYYSDSGSDSPSPTRDGVSRSDASSAKEKDNRMAIDDGGVEKDQIDKTAERVLAARIPKQSDLRVLAERALQADRLEAENKRKDAMINHDNASLVDQIAALIAKTNRTQDGTASAVDDEQVKQQANKWLNDSSPEMKQYLRQAIATSMMSIEQSTLNAFRQEHPVRTPFIKSPAADSAVNDHSKQQQPAQPGDLTIDMSNPDIAGQIETERSRRNELDAKSVHHSNRERERKRDSRDRDRSRSRSPRRDRSDSDSQSQSDSEGWRHSKRSRRDRSRHRSRRDDDDDRRRKANELVKSMMHSTRPRGDAQSVATSNTAMSNGNANASAGRVTSFGLYGSKTAQDETLATIKTYDAARMNMELQNPKNIWHRVHDRLYNPALAQQKGRWDLNPANTMHTHTNMNGVPFGQFYQNNK